MKRPLLAAMLGLLMVCTPWSTLAQTKHGYALTPRAIAPGTWVLEGAVDDFRPANGCNIINTAFIATGAGVVVVNTGPSRRYGEQQRQAIARVTDEPVVKVLNLNLHPDYFFGNQAWVDRPTAALAGSIAPVVGHQRQNHYAYDVGGKRNRDNRNGEEDISQQ